MKTPVILHSHTLQRTLVNETRKPGTELPPWPTASNQSTRNKLQTCIRVLHKTGVAKTNETNKIQKYETLNNKIQTGWAAVQKE